MMKIKPLWCCDNAIMRILGMHIVYSRNRVSTFPPNPSYSLLPMLGKKLGCFSSRWIPVYSTKNVTRCIALGGDDGVEVLNVLAFESTLAITGGFPTEAPELLELTSSLEDGSKAPLLNALREAAICGSAGFHFPGHQRGAGAPPLLADLIGKSAFAHDLPSLPGLDELSTPQGVIAEAQARAALLFGADETYFLVNGSTCGIQAAVMSTCQPGDFLILARNCHMSAISGMILSGALPSYIWPPYDTKWEMALGVTSESIKLSLSEVTRKGGKVGAVLLVSPTYYGVCSSLAEIAEICHEHGVPLIVDEAHGAHFRFHRDLPKTAIEQGADISVQSTHKLLGSLTQSSMLHVKGGRIREDLLRKSLQVLQSSSPSYLLMASLDAARAQMSEPDGTASPCNAIMQVALDHASHSRKELKEIPGLVVLDSETMQDYNNSPIIDPLRITVGLWDLNLTGFEADNILCRDYGVIAELPSLLTITLAISIGTSKQDIDRLVEAFRNLSMRFCMAHRPSQLSFSASYDGDNRVSPSLVNLKFPYSLYHETPAFAKGKSGTSSLDTSQQSTLNSLPLRPLSEAAAENVSFQSYPLCENASPSNLPVSHKVFTGATEDSHSQGSRSTSLKEISLKLSDDNFLFERIGWKLSSILQDGLKLSPRQAFFSKIVRVDIADAAGQVSAELLCPYPPGIPVLVPGEIITEDSLDYLRNIISRGGMVTGGSDPSFLSIYVCEL